MDITDFRLSREDIISEAIMRCKREMYRRSQPSIDYDLLLEQYKKGCKDRLYERYYLSQEECKYITNKYVEAYNMIDKFKDHCDLIISNMKEGTITDQYIPEQIVNGVKKPGYRGYKDVPPLKQTIGDGNAQKVIDFIEDRKDFYVTDHELNKFNFNVYLGDSPNSNLEAVKEYWANQGIKLNIDPRHHTNDYFYDEEHGYLEDEDEE